MYIHIHTYLKEIMMQNFLNLMKTMNAQVQKLNPQA
jgi:hypothetical protein